jgi:hypothetical protein
VEATTAIILRLSDAWGSSLGKSPSSSSQRLRI